MTFRCCDSIELGNGGPVGCIGAMFVSLRDAGRSWLGVQRVALTHALLLSAIKLLTEAL